MSSPPTSITCWIVLGSPWRTYNRSPVTLLMIYEPRALGRLRRRLEIARDKDLSLEEHRGALDDVIKETDAILETFAALLGIAQVESRVRRERFTDVDLSEIAGSVIDAYETVAEDHGQSLEGTLSRMSGSVATKIYSHNCLPTLLKTPFDTARPEPASCSRWTRIPGDQG